MRITFAQGYDSSIRDINNKKVSLGRLTTMASSGKRMVNPSDDPMAWSQSMSVKSSIREIENYNANLEFSMGWNQATEDALNSMSDVMLRAKDSAIRFVSANSPESQEALAQTLDQATEEALGLANTQYGSQYLFAGKNYSGSTPPFDIDISEVVQYQGNTESIEVRIGKNQRQAVNIHGEAAFSTDSTNPDSSSMLQTLVRLRTAMRGGTTADVQTEMGNLDAAYEHLTTKQTLVGTRLEKMEYHQNILSSLKLQDQTKLSELEDADLVEVLTRLQQQRTALEAALKVTGYMDDLNLAKML